MAEILPPCANIAEHGAGEILIAYGIADDGLPLVKRVCKPCSEKMVEAGEFSREAQIKVMALMARDLAEDIERLTKEE